MRVSRRLRGAVASWTLLSFVAGMFLPSVALGAENHAAPPPDAAAVANSLHRRAKALDDIMQQYEKICIDPDTHEVMANTAVLDPSTLDADQSPVMCGDEALRLNAAMKALQDDAAAAMAAGVKLENEEAPGAACLSTGKEGGSLGQLDQLSGSLGKNVDTNCCPNGKPPEELFSGACAEQVACNAIRSSFGLVGSAVSTTIHTLDPHADGKFAQCAGAAGNSDCFNEIIAGIMKDLWSNVTALWDLVKLAGKGIGHEAAKAGKAVGREARHLWHELRGIEDHTSNAAQAASQQSPSWIDEFKKHPVEFMKHMAVELAKQLWEWSKQSFGCDKWAGAPHLSKCVEPITTFECASCDQKMNVVCGMAGLAGGEALVMYFTGGAASGAKFALKAGAEATAKFAEVVKAMRPIAAMSRELATAGTKIAEYGGRAAEVMSKVVRPAAEAVETLAKSKAAVAVGNFAKEAATKSGALALKVAESAPVRLTIKMINGVTYPVRKYVELCNYLFKLGMKQMDQKMAATYAKTAGLMGLDKVHDFYYTLGVGAGADAAAKGAETLADVKKSLTEDKVAFKEVTTAEGKPAIEVELPGSSCPAGKVTFGVGK